MVLTNDNFEPMLPRSSCSTRWNRRQPSTVRLTLWHTRTAVPIVDIYPSVADNAWMYDSPTVSSALNRITALVGEFTGQNAERSQSALQDLQTLFSGRLTAFLANRVHSNDIEDIFQEVWLRAWRSRERFDGRSFNSWMFTIARNLITDHYRRKKHDQLTAEEEQDLAGGSSPEKLQEAGLRTAALEDCLAGLDPTARDLVRARFWGDDYESVCAKHKVNRNQSYKLIFNAKTALKTCLEEKLV